MRRSIIAISCIVGALVTGGVGVAVAGEKGFESGQDHISTIITDAVENDGVVDPDGVDLDGQDSDVVDNKGDNDVVDQDGNDPDVVDTDVESCD